MFYHIIKMKEQYKILTEYVKDISYETPDVETFLYVKDNIAKYNLNIDINSAVIKNKIIEVNIILKFEEKDLEKKKSQFEITYTVVVRIEKDIKEKKEMEEIILVNIPNDVYPRLEDLFLTLLKKSGFSLKIEKKIDFTKLYKEKFS